MNIRAWMICLMASVAFAQPPPSPPPSPSATAVPSDAGSAGFAVEWRVTGFIRQGKSEQASLERQGLMPRFVKEGDRLPGGIVVMEVRYDSRSVVLAKGKETAVLQQESTMTLPVTSPTKPTAPPPVVKKPTVDKATAMQNEAGKWVVAFPNGKSLDMQSYVDRHGGIQGALQHVQELIGREQDPERLAYRQQQLYALQQMAANPAATTSSPNTTSSTGTSSSTQTGDAEAMPKKYPNSNVVF